MYSFFGNNSAFIGHQLSLVLVAYCILRIFTTQVSDKTKLTKGYQS